MSRDLALYFSNKLASEWSASSITGLLSPAVVEDISTTKKWEALDPLVRVRLLLAPMFLRRQELAELRPALTALKSVVAQDNDEWVRVIAAAVGSYDGVLHMDDVLEHSKLVKATLEELKRHGAGADPTIFRPLEEKYLSTVVLEKRLPGSSAQRKHIPEHTHFVLRDANKAPGNSISPVGAVAGGTAAPALATAGISNRPPSGNTGVKIAKPLSGILPGKPPMGPSRLAAPGGVGGGVGVGSSRGGSGGGTGSLFMASRKPLGGGLAARASGSSAVGRSSKANALKQKKKAAIIDINAVAQLNQAAALEKERKQEEERKEREEAALAKIEAKRLEKEAKEERKRREIARAAAAKEAEKEAEKARREAEVAAAKEAKEAERLRKEAAKEEAVRKKAEEQAEREAQRAQREAEKAEKERIKAARAELKRAAAESSGGGGGVNSGSERPAKLSKKNPGSSATNNLSGIPSALATTQQLMDSAVLQPATRPGEAPVVQLIPPQVVLAGLREAQAMDRGVYGDFSLLQQQQLQQQGGGGCGGEEDEDEEDEIQRYIEMGRAAAAAAEMERRGEEEQSGDR